MFLNIKYMKNKNKKYKRKVNYKVIIYSIIGLIGLILTFTINWLYIIIPAIVIWLNQRELKLKR